MTDVGRTFEEKPEPLTDKEKRNTSQNQRCISGFGRILPLWR